MTDAFHDCQKVEKTVWLCDLFIFKDSTFTAVKKDAKFLTRYVKRVLTVNRKCTKGAPFLTKIVY